MVKGILFGEFLQGRKGFFHWSAFNGLFGSFYEIHEIESPGMVLLEIRDTSMDSMNIWLPTMSLRVVERYCPNSFSDRFGCDVGGAFVLESGEAMNNKPGVTT